MTFDDARSVLLVCADEATASIVLRELHDEGLHAVGPVSTARMALALVAQATPGVAILVGETTGRRGASELALELCRTWGVNCRLLPESAASDVIAALRGSAGGDSSDAPILN